VSARNRNAVLDPPVSVLHVGCSRLDQDDIRDRDLIRVRGSAVVLIEILEDPTDVPRGSCREGVG
jgi:hypothetical protein